MRVGSEGGWCYAESSVRLQQKPLGVDVLAGCTMTFCRPLTRAMGNGRGLRGALGSVADAAEWTEKRIREWGDHFLSITQAELKLDNSHQIHSPRQSRSSRISRSEGGQKWGIRHQQRIRREMKGVARLATGQQCRVS